MSEEKIDVKKEYDKLKIKYSLPEFEKLEKDFEFYHLRENIKDESYVLRLIRRRIYDKIVFFCNILERILFPNPSSLILINEAKFFPEEKRKEMFNIYKILMKYERLSLTLDISNDENKNVSFIKNIHKDWPHLRDYCQKIVQEISNRWEKEEEFEEKTGYLG